MIFKGTGVALVTPINENGDVDLKALGKVVRYASKADYLVALGTTGESATLSDQEKELVVDAVIRHNVKDLPLIVGMGSNNTTELCRKLRSWSPPASVKAILSVSPYYNKPSQEGLYRHFMEVADNSPRPVVLYNVPGRTGQNMTAETTLRLAVHPNICGIKEASGNVEQCLKIAAGAPRGFQLISGDDMHTTTIMAMGGVGVISVLANAWPAEFRKITGLAAVGRFQDAARLLSRFGEINPLLYEEGNPGGIKTVMHELGLCSDAVRLPLVTASEGLRKRISEKLKDKKKG